MEEQSTEKKVFNWKKFWLRTAIVILVIMGVFPFALDAYLKRKLPNIINEKTPYQVQLGKFDLNLFSGNLLLKDVKINNKNPKDAKVTQISGTVESLEVSNFGIIKAIFSKNYTADYVKLMSPNLVVKLAPKDKNTEDKKKPNVSFNNLFIQNAQLNVKDNLGKDVLSSTKLNLDLEGINLSNNTSKIPIGFKNFKIDAAQFIVSVNELYQIKADQIKAQNREIDVLNFHLLPRLKPQDYKDKNVFDLQMKRFVATGISITNDSVIAEKTSFDSPILKMISTGKKVEKKDPKKLEIKLALRNLDINNGQLLVENLQQEKQASINQFNFKLNEVLLDKNTVEQRVPFQFKEHDVSVSDVFFKINPNQSISIAKLFSNNRDLTLDGFHLQAIGKNSQKDIWDINANQLMFINNQSQFNGSKVNLKFAGIKLNQPKITLYSAEKKAIKKQTSKPGKSDFDFEALIGNLDIENASFNHILSNGTKKSSVSNINVNLQQLSSNTQQLQAKIPFKVSRHQITAKGIMMDSGPYYTMTLGSITNSGKQTHLQELALKPKYSRAAFSKVIAVQEDLYDISVKDILVMDQLDLFDVHDQLVLDKIVVDGLRCGIYHDLAPPEDKTFRKMFSEKLRNIDRPTFINQIQLKNSYISYEETAEKNDKPGKLYMDQFNADIANVGNAKVAGKPSVVKVDAQFKFYGSAPTHVNWSFDVLDKSDSFKIAGLVKDLSANEVNLFVKPYLNIVLDGDIHTLKFDFYGDKTKIKGDFLLTYNNLYVNFMDKKTGEKKKLASTLTNLLLRNDSKENPKIQKVEKERNPTGSFFNMLWQGIMDGLKKTFI